MNYRLSFLRVFSVVFLIKNVDAGLWGRNTENEGPPSPPVRKPNLTCVLFYGDGLCAFKCRLFGQGAEGHCDNKACTCKYNDITYIEGDNGFEPLPNSLTGRNFYAEPGGGAPVRNAYEEAEDDVDDLTPEENDLKIKLITMMTFSPRRGSGLCQILRENKINIDDVQRLSEKEKTLNGGTSPLAVGSRSLQSQTDILTQGNNIATKILQSLPDTCESPSQSKKLRSNPKVPPRKGVHRQLARLNEDDDDDDLADEKLSLNLNSKSLPNHIDPQGNSHNPNRKQFTLNADALHSPSIKMTSPKHKKVGKGKSPPKIKRVPEKPGRFSFTYPLARSKGHNSNHESPQKPEIRDSQITPLPEYTVQPAVAEILPAEPIRNPAMGDLKMIAPPKPTTPNLQVTGRETNSVPKVIIPKGMRRKRKLKKSKLIVPVTETSKLLLKKTEKPQEKVSEELEAEKQVMSSPQEEPKPQINIEKVTGEDSAIGKPAMLPSSNAESEKQVTDGAPEKKDFNSHETQEQIDGRPNLLYTENTDTTEGTLPPSEAVPPADQSAHKSSPSKEELSSNQQTTDSIGVDDRASGSNSTPLDEKIPQNDVNSQVGTNSRDSDTKKVSPSTWSWPWGWFNESPTKESAALLESPLSSDTTSLPQETQVDSSPTGYVNGSDVQKPASDDIAPQPDESPYTEVKHDVEGQREPQRENPTNEEVLLGQEPESKSSLDVQPQRETAVDSPPETNVPGSDYQAPPSDEPGLISAVDEPKQSTSEPKEHAPVKNGANSDQPLKDSTTLSELPSPQVSPNVKEEPTNKEENKNDLVSPQESEHHAPVELKVPTESSSEPLSSPEIQTQPLGKKGKTMSRKEVTESDNQMPSPNAFVPIEAAADAPEKPDNEKGRDEELEQSRETDLNQNGPLPEEQSENQSSSRPTAAQETNRESSSSPYVKSQPTEKGSAYPTEIFEKGSDNPSSTIVQPSLANEDPSQSSSPSSSDMDPLPAEKEVDSLAAKQTAASVGQVSTPEELKEKDRDFPLEKDATLGNEISSPENPKEDELDSSPQKGGAGSDDNTPTTKEAQPKVGNSQPQKEATGSDNQTSNLEKPGAGELDSPPHKEVGGSDNKTPTTEEAKKREDDSSPEKEATRLENPTPTPKIPKEEKLDSSPQKGISGSNDNTPPTEEAKPKVGDSQPLKEATGLDNKTSNPEKPREGEVASSPQKVLAGSDDNTPTTEEAKPRVDESRPSEEATELDNQISNPEKPGEEELNSSPHDVLAGLDDKTPTTEEAKPDVEDSQTPKEATGLDNETSNPEKPREGEVASSPQKVLAGSDGNAPSTEEAKPRVDESRPSEEATELDNQISNPEKPREEELDSSPQEAVAGSDDNAPSTGEANTKDHISAPMKEVAGSDSEALTLEKPGSINPTDVPAQSNAEHRDSPLLNEFDTSDKRNKDDTSPQPSENPNPKLNKNDPAKGKPQPNDRKTGPKSEDNGPHTLKSEPKIKTEGTAVENSKTPEELPAAQDLKDPKIGGESQPHSNKDGETGIQETEEEQVLEEFEDNDTENPEILSQPSKNAEKPISPKTEDEVKDPPNKSSQREKHPADAASTLKVAPRTEGQQEAIIKNQHNGDTSKDPELHESMLSDANKEPEPKHQKTSDFVLPETELEQEVMEYEDDSEDDGNAHPITATKSLDVLTQDHGDPKLAKGVNGKKPEPEEEQEQIEQEQVIEDYIEKECDHTSPVDTSSNAGEFDTENNGKDAQKEPERGSNKNEASEPVKKHEENNPHETSAPEDTPADLNIKEGSAPIKPAPTAEKAHTGSNGAEEILYEFEDETPVDDVFTPSEQGTNGKTTCPSDADIPQKHDGNREKNDDEAKKNKSLGEPKKHDNTIKVEDTVKTKDAGVQDLDEKEEILHEFDSEENLDDAEPKTEKEVASNDLIPKFPQTSINKENDSQPRAMNIQPAIIPKDTYPLSATPQPENPENVEDGKDTRNSDEETLLDEYTDEEVPAENSEDFFSRLRDLVVLKEYIMKSLASETQ